MPAQPYSTIHAIATQPAVKELVLSAMQEKAQDVLAETTGSVVTTLKAQNKRYKLATDCINGYVTETLVVVAAEQILLNQGTAYFENTFDSNSVKNTLMAILTNSGVEMWNFLSGVSANDLI